MNQLFKRRYILYEVLGQGGMGTVYRARDRLTAQSVALKRLNISSDSTRDIGDDVLLNLAREFETLATLHHPHVIGVRDYGFDDAGRPFFTMDLLNNSQTIVEAGSTRSLHEKIELLVQLLQALAYIHRHNMIHRDLKPGNILVSYGQVQLLDFGLALHTGQSVQLAGTVNYLAPELLRGKPPTHLSDLYSFGVVAYETLTGQYPFQLPEDSSLIDHIVRGKPDLEPLSGMGRIEDSPTRELDEKTIARHLERSHPRLSALHADLAGVIGRVLEKDPAHRFPDAESIIQALCEVCGLPVPASDGPVQDSLLHGALMAGRDPELKLLTDALHQLELAQQGSAWLIGGESGMGKSRLVNELRIRSLVQGALVLWGYARTEDADVYQAWNHPLRLLIMASDMTVEMASVLKSVVPDIDYLVGFPVPDIEKGDVYLERQRLHRTIYALFDRQSQPVVLLLEDLQWMLDSLGLVQYFVEKITELPLMLVATYRHDERPELSALLPGMRHMLLNKLSRQDIAILSDAMLGPAGQDTEVIDFLQQVSGGNVSFLIEAVRELIHVAGSPEAVSADILSENVLPDSIQDILKRRINRLLKNDRRILSLAVVGGIGLDFWVLHTIYPEVDLDQWLMVCLNAGVLDVQEGNWRFAYDHLRRVVLDTLSAEERVDLHEQYALALEYVYGAEDSRLSQLIMHWRQANNPERELSYIQLAAAKAFEKSDYHTVTHLAERALQLDPEPAIERQMNQMLGDIYLLTGEFDRAHTCLLRALGLATGPASQSAAQISLGRLAYRQGEEADARQRWEQALQLVNAEDLPETVATIYNNLGILALDRGHNQEARRYFEPALSMSREVQDDAGLARTLNNLAILESNSGHPISALNFLVDSYDVRERLNDRYGMAIVLNNMAILACNMGNLALGEQYYQESLEITRMTGDQRMLGTLLNNLGEIARKQKNYPQAKHYINEAMVLHRTIASQAGMANSYQLLGLVAFNEKDYKTALKHLNACLERFEVLHNDREILACMGYMAFIHLLDREIDTATQHIQQGIQLMTGDMDALFERQLIFTAIALWFYYQGEPEQSAEWVGVLSRYTITIYDDIYEWLNHVLNLVEFTLPVETRVAAQRRGRTMNPDTALQQLLPLLNAAR